MLRTQAMKWVGLRNSSLSGDERACPFCISLPSGEFGTRNDAFEWPFSAGELANKPKRMAEPKIPGGSSQLKWGPP